MPLVKVEMFVTYLGSNDTVPNPPVLTVPANDSMNVDTAAALSLKWNAVNDAVLYRLQVSRDASFDDTIISVNTPNLAYNLLSANLDGYTTYYWRVLTNNGGHLSAYSPANRFFTYYNTTGVMALSKNNTGVQVFPNPGNGNFTFSNLEKGNKVEIFDANGKLISTGTAKDHLYNLDLEGSDKGVYIYRVSDEKQVKEGKLIVK